MGRLAIASVEPTTVAGVTVDDAKRAGFPTKAALLKAFPRKRGSRLYRVEFALAGPDPRIALRERAELDDDDASQDREAARGGWTAARLIGPWTDATLRLIQSKPESRRATSRPSSASERLPFKADVRKLKALGLTESLEVGYRLSPRGRAFVDSAR